jgi:hypothetical protein
LRNPRKAAPHGRLWLKRQKLPGKIGQAISRAEGKLPGEIDRSFHGPREICVHPCSSVAKSAGRQWERHQPELFSMRWNASRCEGQGVSFNPGISFWAGNVINEAHIGFMSKPTIKSDKFRELVAFRKKDLAVRKTLAKRQERLDASQNAIRVSERATHHQI